MKSLLLPLLLASIAWAQDIVLKATFIAQNNAGQIFKQVEAIDVNNDGVNELPISQCSFYNTITGEIYSPGNYTFLYDNILRYANNSQMRSHGLGEWIIRMQDPDYVIIKDIASGDVLVQLGIDEYNSNIVIYDYDLDGFDDVLFFHDHNVDVYGIATGNPPISPPQELDIQTVGEDYVISWSSVPNATAYRIEWSSALDGGVRFTRIGYTNGTSFTHRNQADQERGFYRVLSEDNGTGVLRMVGQGR